MIAWDEQKHSVYCMENDIDQAFAAAHVLGEKLAYSLRLNPAKIDVVAPFVQEFYQFLISDLPIPYAIKLSTLTGVVDRRVRQASVGHKFLPTEVTQAAGQRLRAVAELYQQTTQFELQGLDAIDAKYPQPTPKSNTHFTPKSTTTHVAKNDDLNDLLKQARNLNVKKSYNEVSSIDEMAQTMDRMSEEMDKVFSNMDKIFDNDLFNNDFSSGLLKHRLKDSNKKNVPHTVRKKFK